MCHKEIGEKHQEEAGDYTDGDAENMQSSRRSNAKGMMILPQSACL
jgi:hypothetical protein